MSVIRKQISMFIPVTEWRALRQEAARLGIPITELCRRWLRPHIEQLPPGFAAGEALQLNQLVSVDRDSRIQVHERQSWCGETETCSTVAHGPCGRFLSTLEMRMSTSPQPGAVLVDLLAEKDDMIQVLTGRLEEIAEQYDRLQRMGNSRSTTSPTAAPSASDAITSKLDDILGLFPDVHPGDQLQRIEQRIDSVLQILENSPRTSSGAPSKGSTGSSNRDKPSPSPAAPAPAPATPVAGGGGKEAGPDFWEAAKARLLGGGNSSGGGAAAGGSSGSVSSAGSTAPAAGTEAATHSSAAALSPNDILVEAPPPAPLDPSATTEELLAGIEVRDRYIAYVVSRVRFAEQASFPDWDALAEVPAELQTALGNVRTQLEQHLRESEISNSLERAALARERSKLFQIKQQLEKQVRHMMSAAAGQDQSHQPKEATTETSDERMLRVMAGKKKES